MLTTTLKLADQYDYLSEKFAKAYHFLRTENLESLPVGNTEIDGKEVFANVQEYTTIPWEECAFEAHDQYFDIQYVVSGRELFGYVKRDGLKEKAPYDSEKDLVFSFWVCHGFGQIPVMVVSSALLLTCRLSRV